MMGRFIELWRRSPATRFVVRSVVVAVVVYVLDAIRLNEAIELTALWHAAAVAGGTALIGFLTPVEPFVGVGKVKRVEVPVPPAVPAPDA